MHALSTPVPVLLYHSIGHNADATTPEDFAAHLHWLEAQGYTTLSLDAFTAIALGRSAPSGLQTLITFDDGYSDLYGRAWPLLKRHRFKATAFLITENVVADESPNDQRRYLSWNEVREMHASGDFDFQSHTHTHTRWAAMDKSPERAARVRNDLVRSRDALARELRVPEERLNHLAWPWGFCDDELEAIGMATGFSFQYLVQTASVTRAGQTLRLPRVCFDQKPVQALARQMPMLTGNLRARALNTASGLYRGLRGRLSY